MNPEGIRLREIRQGDNNLCSHLYVESKNDRLIGTESRWVVDARGGGGVGVVGEGVKGTNFGRKMNKKQHGDSKRRKGQVQGKLRTKRKLWRGTSSILEKAHGEEKERGQK